MWKLTTLKCTLNVHGNLYVNVITHEIEYSLPTSKLIYVCIIDQAPGQYRLIHARTAQAWGHVSSTVLPTCVNSTFITRTARLPTLLPFFFVVLGVKVRSISWNIGPAERAISINMDRSRMSGIGKLPDDDHVPCNKLLHLTARLARTGTCTCTQKMN